MDLFDLYFPKPVVKQCTHEFIEDGMLYCQKCGHKEPVIVEKKYNYVDRPMVVSVPYKAANHFKEKINQLLALENLVVTKSILELCKDCKDHEAIKTVLQQHKQKRYYEHVYSVMKHLGKPIPLLDKLEIDKLVYLFNRFLEVYNKHKKLSNVINYHYLLGKLLPLINRCDVIPHLYKIRNHRKLREHDKTIALIFNELDWN